MPPTSTSGKPSSNSVKSPSIPSQKKNTQKDTHSTLDTAGGSGGRPSKAAYDQEQEELKKEISRIQDRISELRLQIGDTNSGGPNALLIARRKALREELDSLREEQSKGKSSRGKLLEQLRSENDSVQRKIKELNTNRAKLPYKSAAEVDARIRQLEAQIESGTMRIVEEKKALAEIQNLRKAKKLVEAFGPQQESIEAEKAKVEELRKQLDDPRSKSTSDRWSQIKLELDQINDKLNESSKSRDKLFEERNKLQDALTEVFNKKRESTIRHKEANEKHYAKIQAEQQRRIERQKAERQKQELAEIEEIHAEMREQAALPAYGLEIEDCRTLIIYFDKLMGNAPSISDTQTEPLKPTGSSALPKPKEIRQVNGEDGFEGMVAIKKKGTEEEEFFVGGGGGKKNKKNKKAPAEATTSSPLNLPLATINALYALAVTVPMTRDDVTKTIATLSEKKNWFMENQERVTKERIAETEAKIAAAQAKLQKQPAEDTSSDAKNEPESNDKN